MNKIKFNIPFASHENPQTTEAWRRLAGDLGAEFIGPRDLFMGGIHLDGGVQAPAGPWKVTLCGHTTFMKNTQSHMTRAHVCYASQLDFKFSVSRRGFLLDVLKTLQVVRDIEIGDPVFDKALILTANIEESLRALLADDELRRMIQAHPPATLLNQYHDHQLASGPEKLPANVDVLVLETPEEILEPNRLKGMIELLTATLERLVVIGVALRQPPGVQICGPLGLVPLSRPTA